MSNIQTAINCFRENIAHDAQPQTNPEKYNLYNGLIAMAQCLQEIEAMFRDVQARQRHPGRP